MTSPSIQTPAIEGLIRQAIIEDTAVAIDSVLLDATAATTTRPAGLKAGVSATTATAAGGTQCADRRHPRADQRADHRHQRQSALAGVDHEPRRCAGGFVAAGHRGRRRISVQGGTGAAERCRAIR